MTSIAVGIGLLFLPASLGLLTQILWGSAIAQQILTLAILLLCIDQARMAVVDLEAIAAIGQPHNLEIKRFQWVTLSTIGLELLGFYGAILYLGWGAGLVLLSQVWFNLLAGVQLHPQADPAIVPWGIRDRAIVLLADTLGLLLIGLWIAKVTPLIVAGALLAMVLLYGFIKYALPPKP